MGVENGSSRQFNSDELIINADGDPRSMMAMQRLRLMEVNGSNKLVKPSSPDHSFDPMAKLRELGLIEQKSSLEVSRAIGPSNDDLENGSEIEYITEYSQERPMLSGEWVELGSTGVVPTMKPGPQV